MQENDINFHPKPYEATPRQTKKVLICAGICYCLGFFSLLGGCGGAAVFLGLLGLALHKIIAPLAKWYHVG